MKLFIHLSLLFAVHSAFAGQADLNQLAKKMQSDYAQVGQEMNALIITGEVQYQPPIRIVNLYTLEDIDRVLGRCVFKKEGAYHQHLDNQSHARLVNKYSEKIEVLPATVKIAEIRGINTGGLTNNSCALSLRDKDETIVIQGVVHD